MREIRKSGSEGGEPQPNAASLPLFLGPNYSALADSPLAKKKNKAAILAALQRRLRGQRLPEDLPHPAKRSRRIAPITVKEAGHRLFRLPDKSGIPHPASCHIDRVRPRLPDPLS